MKATAVAHPIQGLIKYHGLKDFTLRIPFHDSISVCIQALQTVTTVETNKSFKKDSLTVNGANLTGRNRKRVEVVLQKLKDITGYSGHFKVVSENSLRKGKGLGFSASGFAALGVATCTALDSTIDYVTLSEAVRLGAGSATRSLAGNFAIWYADKDGKSYAKQLSHSENVDFTMIIVPVPSKVKTDEAHAEVLSSPLFEARLKSVGNVVKLMKKAIKEGDTPTICRLAEEDSLNLHAVTMTGKTRMLLWEPETVLTIKSVIKMREEGLPAWYSIDTGPSVFVNTFQKYAGEVANRLKKLRLPDIIVSEVGGKPALTDNHLF
jgi:diphosphomevalonate decarboxylase